MPTFDQIQVSKLLALVLLSLSVSFDHLWKLSNINHNVASINIVLSTVPALAPNQFISLGLNNVQALVSGLLAEALMDHKYGHTLF